MREKADFTHDPLKNRCPVRKEAGFAHGTGTLLFAEQFSDDIPAQSQHTLDLPFGCVVFRPHPSRQMQLVFYWKHCRSSASIFLFAQEGQDCEHFVV